VTCRVEFRHFRGRTSTRRTEHSKRAVTEHTELQAVYGRICISSLIKTISTSFVGDGRELKEHYENKGRPEVLQVQVRGEYAYAAAGKAGLRVYDVAQIDHKGFSERITDGARFAARTEILRPDQVRDGGRCPIDMAVIRLVGERCRT